MPQDPCRDCELYKQEGCSHVDSFLCKVEDCDMLAKYLRFREEIRNMMLETRKIKTPVPYA